MKTLVFIFSLLLSPWLVKAQQTTSLQFKDKQLSASQYIHRQFVQNVPPGITDSLCAYLLTSMKFTIKPDGSLTNIVASVGLPTSLYEPLKKAILASQNHWANRRKASVDCILPIMILPSNLCPGEERPNYTLQSGAQMFKYSGEYINFKYKDFFDYTKGMVEGVTLSPILIHNSKIF